MTKEEAFKLIIQATGAVSANRETHLQIQVALDVISEALQEGIVDKPDDSA